MSDTDGPQKVKLYAPVLGGDVNELAFMKALRCVAPSASMTAIRRATAALFQGKYSEERPLTVYVDQVGRVGALIALCDVYGIKCQPAP